MSDGTDRIADIQQSVTAIEHHFRRINCALWLYRALLVLSIATNVALAFRVWG